MVLEYAAGGDLYGLLRRAGGRLGEQQAVDLVLQPFLSALAYMHSKGIVHRYGSGVALPAAASAASSSA
jgi:aurora kinase